MRKSATCVATTAGSCGAFLFLENSIAIRPVGFCNVNELFEINTEQAHSIEVLRGPAVLDAVAHAQQVGSLLTCVQAAPRRSAC